MLTINHMYYIPCLVVRCQPFPPVAECGATTIVILLNDGMPTRLPDGSPMLGLPAVVIPPEVTLVASKAQDLHDAGYDVYVLGFALNNNTERNFLHEIATGGGTDQAIFADNTADLEAAFNAIFDGVSSRQSSASGISLSTNSNNGNSAIVQALFDPEITNVAETETVNWSGSLFTYFVDENGYFREDSDGDATLAPNTPDADSGYTVDSAFDFYYDETDQITKIQRLNVTIAGDTITHTNDGTPVALDQLKPIWEASALLDTLDQTEIVNQRDYTSIAAAGAPGRYIFSWINSDAVVETNKFDSSELIEFTWDATGSNTINSTNKGILNVTTDAAAEDLVNFIRGQEGIANSRNRTVDTTKYLLGDIVHATPTYVGKPVANYDTRHGDTTYASFKERYKNRRHMVYAGANDGMLHAFNAGFWDPISLTYTPGDPAHELGAEVWAFIPYNLLPHLGFLKDQAYTKDFHVYYMDGHIQTFDVNIFDKTITDGNGETTYPGGWGTILVAGMRLGGGDFDVDHDNNGGTADITTQSAYVILDVTNPEQEPIVLAEITDDELGFTTGKPALIKQRVAGTGNDFNNPATNNWYLVFGSGPTEIQTATSLQQAKLFVLELTDDPGTMTLSDTDALKTVTNTPLANSFTGDISVADWDNNYQDDAAYFGTITGTEASPGGDIRRYVTSTNDVKILLDTEQPMPYAPLLRERPLGGPWVFAGSGRLFTAEDFTIEYPDPSTFYGIKDAAPYTATSNMADILDVTDNGIEPDGSLTTPIAAADSPCTLITAIDSFDELKECMLGDDHAGWKRDYDQTVGDPSSRNSSSSASFRDILFYTGHNPDDGALACDIGEGDSDLFVVDFHTGLSLLINNGTSTGIFGFDKDAVSPTAVASINLGKGVANTPVLRYVPRTEDGGPGIIVNSPLSTGETTRRALPLPPVETGRKSWTELEI